MRMCKIALILLCCLIFATKTKGLTCLHCINAGSHEKCERVGKIVMCKGRDDLCKTEMRIFDAPRGWKLITKGCKQRNACLNNQRNNPCSGSSNPLCYCCCSEDGCNRGEDSCKVASAASGGRADVRSVGCKSRPRWFRNGNFYCTDGGKVGSRCRFTCWRFYAMVEGRAESICQRNGEWSSAPPRCEALRCFPRYSFVPNGNVFCSNYNNYRSLCRLTCRRGFTRIGPSSTVCDVTRSTPLRGRWTNQQARCARKSSIIRCPRFATPEKATVKCTAANLIGSKCSFACVDGFSLIGFDTTSCRRIQSQKLKWSSSSPSCVVKRCTQIADVANRITNCDNGNLLNSTCLFACADNYHMIGREEVTCIQSGANAAEWNNPLPVCQPKCDVIQSLPGGFVECLAGNHVGAVCSFNCEDDFKLIGSYHVTCVERSNAAVWDDSLPICVKTCHEVNEIVNGRVTCSEGSILKSFCSFECLPGFQLIGSKTTSCVETEDGGTMWQNGIPKCESKSHWKL